jgi:type I restriction enzyme, S subunit
MIEGLKPYKKYKESGLTWLDHIPFGWNEQRSKYLFREVDRRSVSGLEMRLSMSQRHGLIPSTDVKEKRLVAETNIGGKICEPGDLVLNRLKAHLGVFALASQKGVVSPDYTVLRSIGSINGRYFCTLYRSPFCGQELRRTAKGIVEGFLRLYTDQFYDIRVPVPPSDEQAAIVRFLDHANRKIDRFIRAKRKLIGLLNEQKQAIIHQAVTRGLDPNVKLKPSGIPWLGDIPRHWEVRRAKYLFCEVDDRSKEGKETHLAMSQRLGLVPSNLVNSAMRSESYAGAKLCQEGDLVLNRLKAHLGVFAQAKQVGVISPDYSVFRKRASISMDYYENVLRSSACRRELRVRAKGLVEGFWRLYTDDFYDIRLPVPPLDEQKQIISATSVETDALTAAIARTEREILLMQEYRTRLTADVVTGKLDVREAAKRLPDQPDELLPDDDLEGDDVDAEMQEEDEA